MRRFAALSLFPVIPVVLIAAFFAFRQVASSVAVDAAVSMTPDLTPAVIIDPGHGGFDGGAVCYQVVEKNINLGISLKLRDLLRVCGYHVVLTRESDVSTADSSTEGKSTRNKKVSDMHNRLDLMQSHSNAVFISIHQNKFQQSKYYGAQVFYSPNHPGSQLLAQKIQETFKMLLQPENQREIKKAGSELFLLYNARQPAVLVECGFLSNPQECQKLTQEVYQQQIALTILDAVTNYLSPGASAGLESAG